jgi:arylsulfatase
VKDTGSLRDQFHHVNDIVPTIYEAIGITPPDTYRGLEQMPISGVAMNYTFDDKEAKTRKLVQYYEMVGHRGIYANGWKAVTRHTPGVSFDDDVWELYHVEADRSETNDLAKQEPDRLNELIALWWEEAENEGVLPLDDRGLELFGINFKKNSPHPESRKYVYRPPMAPLPSQASAAMGGRSWDMEAVVDRGDAEGGVIYATGTENSGFSFYIFDNRLVFDYNFFGEHLVVRSNAELPTGPSTLTCQLRRTGKAGYVVLLVNQEEVGRMELPFVMRVISSVGPSVAYDHGSPVAFDYANRSDGFPFEGTLESVTITLIDTKKDPKTAEAQARAEMGRQ